MDPYFRCQTALAHLISFKAVNKVRDSPHEFALWEEFYVPFWETLFRAYVKRTKAKDPEIEKTISDSYDKSILGTRLTIQEYAKLLSCIGKLYDDLKYSSPEKESIESPFDCNLKMSWSLQP